MWKDILQAITDALSVATFQPRHKGRPRREEPEACCPERRT